LVKVLNAGIVPVKTKKEMLVGGVRIKSKNARVAKSIACRVLTSKRIVVKTECLQFAQGAK